MNNKNYLIAFSHMDKIGPRTVAKLLTHWPDLSQLFNRSADELLQLNIPKTQAVAIASFNLQQIEADLHWEEADGNHLLTWCDPSYPALLKEIPDPPLVLYAQGDLTSLCQPAIAVVGTRKPSITGRETARQFSFELASRGVAIVSGLALGVDAQAHQGCLDAHGKTIAVMATGIDCIYPRSHSKLAQLICQNGLLISEFPLKSAPVAGHFPRRNRIISGLSLATLVVEAATKSGSLITARYALEQNRDVLAIPGSIYNPNSRGCHYLLQQGAKLVTSCDDVLNELGFELQPISTTNPPVRLADEKANLVQYVGFETTTVDQLIARSGLTYELVMCSLANLELQGFIKMVPGGYTRCIL